MEDFSNEPSEKNKERRRAKLVEMDASSCYSLRAVETTGTGHVHARSPSEAVDSSVFGEAWNGDIPSNFLNRFLDFFPCDNEEFDKNSLVQVVQRCPNMF